MLCFSSSTSVGSLSRSAPGRPVCPLSPHVPRSLGAPARPRPSPSSWSDFLIRKPARQPPGLPREPGVLPHAQYPDSPVPPASRGGSHLLPAVTPDCPASAPSRSLLPACPPPQLIGSPVSQRPPSSHDRSASPYDVTLAPCECESSKAVPRAWAPGTLSSARHTL